MKTQIWNGLTEKKQTRVVDGSCLPAQFIAGGMESVNRTANVLVIDLSGSTAEPVSNNDNRTKLECEKQAASIFATNIPLNSYLGVIAFSDSAQVIFPMQVLNEKLTVANMIQGCTIGGATSMRAALIETENELNRAPSGFFKRAYLMTDGQSTDGCIRSIADRIKNEGTQLHFIGVGAGSQIDDNLMRSVASITATGEICYKHFSDLDKLAGFIRRQTTMVSR